MIQFIAIPVKLQYGYQKNGSLMKQFFPNRGTMPFKELFDDFDFGFPNLFNQNFRNLDSIWRQRLKGQQKNFDSRIFKKATPPKREIIH